LKIILMARRDEGAEGAMSGLARVSLARAVAMEDAARAEGEFRAATFRRAAAIAKIVYIDDARVAILVAHADRRLRDNAEVSLHNYHSCLFSPGARNYGV
jgi:hypothetical protein